MVPYFKKAKLSLTFIKINRFPPDFFIIDFKYIIIKYLNLIKYHVTLIYIEVLVFDLRFNAVLEC